jgi:hypothetical protein
MTEKLFDIKLEEFIELAKAELPVNPEVVRLAVHSAIKRLNKKELTTEDLANLKVYDDLLNRWYASLPDNPDYLVYSDPYYIIDLWICWKKYSRQTIMTLHRKPNGTSAADTFGKVDKIVDLGCGVGFTTSLLKSYWPDAEIVGTNIPDTFQHRIASILGEKYGFTMVNTLEEVGGDNDIVFASEYFEHFEDPITHLKEVVEALHPRYLITANAFNPDAIGHFDEYQVGIMTYPDKDMSKIFTNTMRSLGYERHSMKMFNDRPIIWVRK